MGIFRRKNSKEKELGELILVFDIRSSSVGGALFRVSKSGISKIFFTVREPIVLLEEMDIDQFFSLTMKSLSVVAGKISKSGIGSPAKIFCVLSSPWYGSQTRVIRLEKNTPFIFTSKLADSLTKKEVDLFQEEHLEKYMYAGSSVLPIELKNMKTILNGYATSKPINQKAKNLEMTIFISISSEQFIQKVQEIVASNFHREDVKFSSFAMASFAVARDIFTEYDNFLLIDIGGEVTDIAMIKKGILSESVSFPIGRNFIIRGLAKATFSTLDEAQSLISLHKDAHADAETQEELDKILGSLRAEWLKKFQESLANLSKDISIPATILITVDKDLAEFFRKTIEAEQFSQYTLAESKFVVILLGSEVLNKFVILDKNIPNDPCLTIESIYINRFLL